MTTRQISSKQNCQVSSTQDDFVHECTCNVALKQFRKDIKQLESNTRSCDAQRTKNCKKNTSSTCKTNRATPIKAKTTSKTLPQTPSKNKTWFEVLAESPKKPEKNEAGGCDSSCKYATIFSNLVPKSDEELKPKVKQFGLLMDILSKKIHETNDRELVHIVNEINNVVHSSKVQEDFSKTKHFKKSIPQSYDNSKRSYSIHESRQDSQKHLLRKKLAEIEKAAEKPNRERDDIKLKALVKLLENMQSVNEKTEIQQESLRHLTELINKLCKENKMLNDLKDNRIALESKLASTITENRYLKERVQFLEMECERSHRLLEAKEEEIASLKNRVGKIRETITRKIDFGVHPEIDDRSITLDLDDTVATVPSSHENFDALIRPASSSPTRSIDYTNKQKLSKRAEDDDSGIQSNAQDNEKYSGKLPINYKNAILELKDNVKKAMEEFKLDTRLNDVSLDLSDATYKCSLSSLNLNS